MHPVEFRDHIFVDEQETQLGRTANTFCQQHVGGETSPTLDVDCAGRLFIGTEHLNGSVAADFNPQRVVDPWLWVAALPFFALLGIGARVARRGP